MGMTERDGVDQARPAATLLDSHQTEAVKAALGVLAHVGRADQHGARMMLREYPWGNVTVDRWKLVRRRDWDAIRGVLRRFLDGEHTTEDVDKVRRFLTREDW